MKHISVCNVELNHMNIGMFRVLKNTLGIYRSVCGFLGNIIEAEWEDISSFGTQKEQLTYVEHLIHRTKKNPEPKYPNFDQMFYKFPSYYRRSAINFVLGQVSSYHTRLKEYQEERYQAVSNGTRFRKKPPVLNVETNACPSLYRSQSFREDGSRIMIKAYIRNTWDWIEVSMPSRDKKCLDKKRMEAADLLSPFLVYRYHRFYLAFPVRYPFVPFPDTPISEQCILAVDLGINRGAVCSVMRADGTILARVYDPFASERDQINRMLDKLPDLARKTGKGQSLAAFYTKLAGIKDNYVRKLSSWISKTAVKHGVYGVVFEHLGKMKGRKKKIRIHHWCKRRIQELSKGMLFRHGIRTFLINPKNTSALAFDGSGKVLRDIDNFSLCTFTTGKRYDCDLNASYNIGARYFLRTMEKSMLETEWSELTAKVPGFPKRTNYTLAALRAVLAVV